MRGITHTLHCDAEDGLCSMWALDYYEATAATVDGVRITSTERAPGWRSTNTRDYCPKHAAAIRQEAGQ